MNRCTRKIQIRNKTLRSVKGTKPVVLRLGELLHHDLERACHLGVKFDLTVVRTDLLDVGKDQILLLKIPACLGLDGFDHLLLRNAEVPKIPLPRASISQPKTIRSPTPTPHDLRSTYLPKIWPFSPTFFLMMNLPMVASAVAIALASFFSASLAASSFSCCMRICSRMLQVRHRSFRKSQHQSLSSSHSWKTPTFQ